MRHQWKAQLLVGIVAGIILGLWRALIVVLTIFHFLYVLITGKKIKELAKFCHIWNDQIYKYLKYMTFATNKRVFPFTELGRIVDPVDFTKNPNGLEEPKPRKR